MRVPFSKAYPTQAENDSLPRLQFLLRHNDRTLNLNGLVDSGATVCVLPYRVGIELGYIWDERKATLRLGGSLGVHSAQGVIAHAQIGDFPPVRLVFAWVKTDTVPVILGHTNFFMEFDVCLFRANYEFEITPKAHVN